MHKLNEKGDLLIPLVLVSLLFVLTLAFGFWAFTGRQDYKNNSDEKVAEAVEAAEEAIALEKDAEFAEEIKLPYSTYTGPAAFGTVTIQYPKSWSVYVDESGQSSLPLSGFMHPGYVPADEETNFGLRFEVTGRSYDIELKSFDNSVRTGKVSVSAYRLPKVDTVLGSKITGELDTDKRGQMVILPMRDKTLKIWTEGDSYNADFEKILEQLTFFP